MNPSFDLHANGESSEDTNSERMMENLNQSNQQLLQTIEKLKAENSKLQLFINIAADELRTPIMPIVGYSEILQEEIGERKEIKGIIYNANRVNVGKLLVIIGTGQGLITISLHILLEIQSGRILSSENNYIIWLTSSATGLGILFAIISQSLSKGRSKSVVSRAIKLAFGRKEGKKDLEEGKE